jgi:hypothetical protein
MAPLFLHPSRAPGTLKCGPVETSTQGDIMLRIDLEDILMALGDRDPETTYYLDRETGQVIPLFSGMFDPEDPEFIDEDELIASSRYVAIEPVSSHEAFRWMEDFAAGVAEPGVGRRLRSALEMRRPFREFKDVLAEHPTERAAWFGYQADRLVEAARDWLLSEEIEAELTRRVAPEARASSPPA